MSRGLPSMTALLGMLAIAGYQNRDKIAEMLGGANKPRGDQANAGQGGASTNQGGLGGLLGQLGGALGGASAGGILSGGLGELLERFRQNGQGDTADSWVNSGPTSRATPLSSSRRSVPMCWPNWPSRPGYRATSWCRGCAATCPTPSTSTPRRAACRPTPRPRRR